MKRIILGCALFVLLISVTSLTPATKHTYTSEEANFSITFPTKFESSEEVDDDFRSVKTQCISDDMIYLAIYSVHEEDISGSKELTNISMRAFLEGLGATADSESTWKVGKYKGLKSTFEVSSGNLVGEYRVVLIGQIQYQITSVAPKNVWDKKEAKKFLKSFKVRK